MKNLRGEKTQMKIKPIILKDKDNKKKTLEFGEPFLSDGTFWLNLRIGKENINTIKLDEPELEKIFKHLIKYGFKK